MSRERMREALAGYLFILPTVLGFLIFTAGPMIAALALSLFEWDLVRSPHFIGLGNFSALSHDARLALTLKNTAVFVLGDVILNLGLGLLLALAINRKLPTLLRFFFRTCYFFPVIVSFASVSIVWEFMLNTNFGPINYYLSRIGLHHIPWLTSSRYALLTVILINVWKNVGFNMVLFLAGLQNIPRHLLEAASIDGANSWDRFRFVTLPMLTPVIFFALVITLIADFQVFDAPFIMTKGGPGDASRTLVLYLYETGFRFFRMGYASTISLCLFVVIMVLTIFQVKLSERWVFYQ